MKYYVCENILEFIVIIQDSPNIIKGWVSFSVRYSGFSEYWTLFKIKIRMTCVYKEYEINAIMAQE